MKRDMDLIRKLLLAAEERGTAHGEIQVDGYTEAQIGYHSYLIVDAGLADGINVKTRRDEARNYRLTHPTWNGHEFLDAARNETIWNQAKSIAKEKGMTLGLEAMKAVLQSLVKGALG